jgi:colanic acid/amylovoran biosynthesis glycosyltransferase
LDAPRLGQLLGLPYSVTAHAFDIWLMPRNLTEKLRRAAFVSTGSEYNACWLRSLGARVEVIVMGVDVSVFRRSAPLPGGRVVLAVGRLVRKKGYDVLARAAASLEARVVVVGEGPMACELAGVELVGAVDPARVRSLMESADVLAMPSVVAPDGDRDSMPVVVKEAMAMELCVVASDEVGLPECVRPPWGLLVPAGDPSALAAALAEVLSRPLAERARAGAAARAWVCENADLYGEARRLSALISPGAAGAALSGNEG